MRKSQEFAADTPVIELKNARNAEKNATLTARLTDSSSSTKRKMIRAGKKSKGAGLKNKELGNLHLLVNPAAMTLPRTKRRVHAP